MNWLAHLYLSECDLDMRLGNLLADVVRGPRREGMSEAFVRGARCHLAIDAYTDAHPLVARSRARIAAPYRRFAGVLADVFYDHFLAREWAWYAGGSLDEFVGSLRAAVLVRNPPLPDDARVIVDRMIVERRLLGYREAGGMERALAGIGARIERRFARPANLHGAMRVLECEGEGLREDFAAFFPQLHEHVRCWLREEG